MNELGETLRAWRNRLSPAQVGLPAVVNRRTPGLRREELAALAGASVEYIVRLEQGRATHPSAQMLGSLARALQLTESEREHLYRLGGVAEPGRSVVPGHIPRGVRRLIDRLGDVPLAVHSAAWDLLYWNELWAALTGDPTTLRGVERNVAWRHFTGAPGSMIFDEEHSEEFSADLAADLRASLGRYPQDSPLRQLIARLRAVSPEFERHWRTAHVAQHRSSTKTAVHPVLGPVVVDCDVLAVPGNDLRIVLYTAVPNSEDASKLDMLRVLGLQQLVDYARLIPTSETL